MQVQGREASGGSPLDSAASLSLRVVARVPFALRLHPLGDLESVVELKHDLLLLEKSGCRLADSRYGLGCNLLLSRRLLRCGLLGGLHRCRRLRFLAGCLLGLWGSKRGLGFGQKVDFALAWNGCVYGEGETESKPGELVI